MTPGTAAASRPALSRSAKLATKPLSVNRPPAVVTSMPVASTDVSATSLERTAAVSSASLPDRAVPVPAADSPAMSPAMSPLPFTRPLPWPSPISMAVQPARPKPASRSGNNRVAERAAFMRPQGPALRIAARPASASTTRRSRRGCADSPCRRRVRPACRYSRRARPGVSAAASSSLSGPILAAAGRYAIIVDYTYVGACDQRRSGVSSRRGAEVAEMQEERLSAHIRASVDAALAEDVGAGDVTAALIDAGARSRATVVCREDAILCGRAWFDRVFAVLDGTVRIEWRADDGERLAPGETVCSLDGPARPILTGERTALNFLQTLSGTATAAARYAAAVAHTGCRILDTRKTIPGLRLAQKYAVRCGGAVNHRLGLFDAVLVKENHIFACGGIRAAVARARAENPVLPVEVEVENIDELRVRSEERR